MKIKPSSRLLSIVFSSALIFCGCEKEEEEFTTAEAKVISEEALVDASFQDADNIGSIVLQVPSESEYSGGRKSTTIIVDDERFNCDGVVVTIEPGANSTLQQPNGVLTVDFGRVGCTEAAGNVRKGKLIYSYNGWWFKGGSTVTMTTEDYSINEIRLAGTRVSSNITASESDPLKFHVALEGTATFPDGDVAERQSDVTWTWKRGVNPALDEVFVHANSMASGISKEGINYTLLVSNELVYKRLCAIAVSGVKRYLIEGEKEISVNYGDGNCDKVLTVTSNGKTRTITL